MNKWRLLLSGPQPPFLNMAIDAYLLHAGMPTFRVYEWITSTLSLGYFQPYPQENFFKNFPAETPIVRRMTGGGAIFHHQELTFSWVIPYSQTFPKKIEASYERIHSFLIQSFAQLGYTLSLRGGHTEEQDFFCYNRQNPYDLLWNHKKLIGCAQRRTKDAFLHHGSIPYGKNPIYSEWNYLPEPKLAQRWIPAIKEILQTALSIELEEQPLSPQEEDDCQSFVKQFQSSSYLKRR